ncbi:MAG: hypothetical protein NVSMB29_01520 [Candidatus Dormibacteria bacterium]
MRRVGPGWWCLAAGLAVIVFLWWPVFLGQRTLLGGDILNQFIPWKTGSAPLAHNEAMSDPMSQFLPSLTLLRQDLASGQLPLWNPYSLNGTPLLANGTSAVLSPFTWLALPFQPDHGYSLAMLARFVVAATGMGFFVRQLGARSVSAAFAGVAYASSSFIVVWLGHPQSGVAALMPWAFACVERHLRSRSPRALAGLAVAVALQFFAGNEETSFHMGVFLAVWVVVRALVQPNGRIRRFLSLAGTGVLGAGLAGVQVIPFLAVLQGSTLAEDRVRGGAGLGFLAPSALASWLIPNGHGNPGIDQVTGRLPNFPESTAFIGVGALLLIVPGAILLWRVSRSAGLLLAGGLLFSVLTVYGVITPVVGHLPGFNASNNGRLTALACFCAAALAGCGLELLLRRRPLRLPRRAALAPLALAALGIAGLAICALILKRKGAGVDTLLGSIHGQIGFWAVVCALSLGAGACLFTAGMMGSVGPWVAGGFFTLALAEASLFAAPFQPRTAPSDNPPPSAAVDWLRARSGNDKLAAPGLAMFPNLSVRYGLYDTRGVDVLLNPRLRIFWRAADPQYDDSTLYTELHSPNQRWLAAAGVRWYLSESGNVLPQTRVRYRSALTAVAEVPDSRPFVFGVTSDSVSRVSSAAAAAAAMTQDPLGPVAVEGCCGPAATSVTAPTLQPVTIVRRDQAALKLHVVMPREGVVVVLQSFAPGWSAEVDGRAAPIQAADVLFQAVSVPAGSHDIALRYGSPTAVFGMWVSLVAVVLVGLLCVPAGWPARLLRTIPRRPRRGNKPDRGRG